MLRMLLLTPIWMLVMPASAPSACRARTHSSSPSATAGIGLRLAPRLSRSLATCSNFARLPLLLHPLPEQPGPAESSGLSRGDSDPRHDRAATRFLLRRARRQPREVACILRDLWIVPAPDRPAASGSPIHSPTCRRRICRRELQQHWFRPGSRAGAALHPE